MEQGLQTLFASHEGGPIIEMCNNNTIYYDVQTFLRNLV